METTAVSLEDTVWLCCVWWLVIDSVTNYQSPRVSLRLPVLLGGSPFFLEAPYICMPYIS